MRKKSNTGMHCISSVSYSRIESIKKSRIKSESIVQTDARLIVGTQKTAWICG